MGGFSESNHLRLIFLVKEVIPHEEDACVLLVCMLHSLVVCAREIVSQGKLFTQQQIEGYVP